MAKDKIIHYLVQIAIAFDQLLNTFLNGMADETLSARAYRMEQKGHKYWSWTARAINIIFFWQNNHCRGAYNRELERKHLPEAYTEAGK